MIELLKVLSGWDFTCQESRPAIDKWSIIKLKHFCPVKETTNGRKKKPTERERIFAGYTSDRGLISRI